MTNLLGQANLGEIAWLMLKQRNACSGSGTSVAFVVHKTVIPRLRFDFRTPPFYKLSCTLFLLFIQLPAYVPDLLGASDTSKVSSHADSRLVGSRIVTPKAICALLRFEANAAGFCADPFFTNRRCSASSDLRQSGLVWLCTRFVTTDLCGVRSTMSSGFEQEYFFCSFSSTEVPSFKKKPSVICCSSITCKLLEVHMLCFSVSMMLDHSQFFCSQEWPTEQWQVQQRMKHMTLTSLPLEVVPVVSELPDSPQWTTVRPH